MRRDLQLKESETENQGSAEAPLVTQVLQSVCEDVFESGEKRFLPLNVQCWLSLTAERTHADHHRF